MMPYLVTDKNNKMPPQLKKYLFPGVVLVVFVLMGRCGGCEEGNGFGECQKYEETEGICRIVSVNPAPADQYNCTNDPVEVVFEFEPGGASSFHLTIDGGRNPPRVWIEDEGLLEGTEHPCTEESQLEDGPCPPFRYTFNDVDYQAAADMCALE